MGSETKIVGYIRVSTSQQADEGVSLEAQKARLEAYAFAMGLDLVGIEVDAGESAKSLNRPGLQRALDALKTGKATGLLVAKLDRLTRSVKDLGDLLEKYFASSFSLLSVGDSIDTRTAGGRMVLNILTTVTQWEREAGSERTKAALSELKRQGKKLGRPVVGLPAETQALVRKLYDSGNFSHTSLAEELNRRGVPTATGRGKWWKNQVYLALNE